MDKYCEECKEKVAECKCPPMPWESPQPEKPALYSIWRHKSGTPYVVIGFTNEHADDANDPNSRYPLTIRYADTDGREWSRPLSKWHDSMTVAGSGDGAGVADAVLNKINPWYRDITEACTVANINWHMDNPHQTINDLINWHVQIALDPKVSKEARDLIAKGEAEAGNKIQNSLLGDLVPSQAVPWEIVKEGIQRDRPVSTIARYPVFGGWMVVIDGYPSFVPDPRHDWS